jgi:DNA polymerase (family X)
MTTNTEIAAQFEELAERLQQRHESWFKIAAYRKAAATIRATPEPVESIAARGQLRTLPGVGAAIAVKILDYLATGHIPALDRVRAEQRAASPDAEPGPTVQR